MPFHVRIRNIGWIIACLLVAVPLVAANVLPSFPDPDSFYHAKMALILRDQGLLYAFPWFQFTELKDTFANPHLLYHAALIPFVSAFDPLVGMRVSAVVFGLVALASLFLVLRALKVPLPLLFVSAAALSIGFMHRMALPRAPALSIALLLFLTWAMRAKRPLLCFLLSSTFVWFYHGWPVALLSLGALLAGDLLARRVDAPEGFWRCGLDTLREWCVTAGSVLAGLAAGLVVNPYFPHNIAFSVVDIFKIGVVNYQGTLPVGQEWLPASVADYVSQNAPTALFWLACFCLFLPGIRLRGALVKRTEIADVFAFFLLAGGYTLLTLKSARYVEYAIPFVILSAGTFFRFGEPFVRQELVPFVESWIRRSSWRRPLLLFCASILVIVLAAEEWRSLLRTRPYFRVEQYQIAADWMRENIPVGETVFHNSWDFSLILWYLDDEHRYLAGLDPTFMYDEDPEAFEVWRSLVNGDEKNVSRIVSTFHARTVVVDTRLDGSAKLIKNLDQSDVFREVAHNTWIRIYAHTTLL
ncbi:hypothetical protein HY734_00485 [Candidatus Uhrbacteria bacterium]|nr:hypothetical protein [Candidatus Uhrbacteria bacterium]